MTTGGEYEATVTVGKDGEDVVTGTTGVTNGRGECTLSIPDPDYWTPETPELYNLTVELRADG